MEMSAEATDGSTQHQRPRLTLSTTQVLKEKKVRDIYSWYYVNASGNIKSQPFHAQEAVNLTNRLECTDGIVICPPCSIAIFGNYSKVQC